jgi:carboxyl-terminal processing protease
MNRTSHGPVRKSLAVLTLLFVTLSTSAQTRDSEPRDFADRFERVWKTTQQRFYDPKMHGLDWKAVGDKYRDKAAAATTHAEFQQVVNQMLDELHASHAAYLTSDDLEFYLLQALFRNDLDNIQMEHIGVTGVRDGNAFVVRAILDGSPAVKAGIRVGDRITDVDGKPFSTVGPFKGKEERSVPITIVRGAETLHFTVNPTRENPQRAFLDAMSRSARIIETDGKRIGYVHLWTMTNDRFRENLEAILTGKLANTDGIVLDIRDGFGGHPTKFTDVLFRPAVRWEQTGRGSAKSSSIAGYGKPMVLLINEGTRSAKESFSYQIKKTGRGTLVGKTTAGAFLGAGGYAIGSDGYLELPIVNITLDGNRLEGVGVSPDVVVEAEDTYGPKDKQLARAVEVLMPKLTQKRAVAAP